MSEKVKFRQRKKTVKAGVRDLGIDFSTGKIKIKNKQNSPARTDAEQMLQELREIEDIEDFDDGDDGMPSSYPGDIPDAELPDDDEMDILSNPVFLKKKKKIIAENNRKMSKPKKSKSRSRTPSPPKSYPSRPVVRPKKMVEKPPPVLDDGWDSFSDSDNDTLPPPPKPPKSRAMPSFEDEDDYMTDGDGFDDDFEDDSEIAEMEQKRKEEDEKVEHQELLSRLNTMRTNRPDLNIPKFTAKSNLRTMRLEMGRVKHLMHIENTKSTHRQFLMNLCAIAEMASQRFLPAAYKDSMTGFSAHIKSDIEAYDPVFEQFAETDTGLAKYITRSGGSPYRQLLFVFGLQVMGFVLFNYKLGKKNMSTSDIKREHPEIVSELQREVEKENMFEVEQRINIEVEKRIKLYEMQFQMEREKLHKMNQFYMSQHNSFLQQPSSFPTPAPPPSQPKPSPVNEHEDILRILQNQNSTPAVSAPLPPKTVKTELPAGKNKKGEEIKINKFPPPLSSTIQQSMLNEQNKKIGVEVA
jgi:hypothetical protein